MCYFSTKQRYQSTTQRLHCGSLWMVMSIECILCFDTSGSKSDSWNGVSEHDFVFFCPPCPPLVEMWHVFTSWFDAQLEIWQAFSSFPPKQQERIQWNTDRASLTCDVQLQRPTIRFTKELLVVLLQPLAVLAPGRFQNTSESVPFRCCSVLWWSTALRWQNQRVSKVLGILQLLPVRKLDFQRNCSMQQT